MLGAAPLSRVCYAAAHVVADPLAGGDPTGPAQLDWEATLGFRRHLWAHGLRVAEAMDTAQRGAGTDQLTGPASLDDVRRAYAEQVEFVEGEGAPVILMASRALAAAASGA